LGILLIFKPSLQKPVVLYSSLHASITKLCTYNLLCKVHYSDSKCQYTYIYINICGCQKTKFSKTILICNTINPRINPSQWEFGKKRWQSCHLLMHNKFPYEQTNNRSNVPVFPLKIMTIPCLLSMLNWTITTNVYKNICAT